jgi:hypothetical protein
VRHSWKVCLRERGLTLDAQIGRVLERVEPVHARLVGLIPGQDVSAQLVIVCDFDDEDGEDELPDVATTEDRKLLEKLPGQHQLLGWFLTSEHHQVRLAGSWVAQRDLVRFGHVARLDGSQSLAETLAGLPQELQRVGEGALRGGALRISLVLFDQVCLKGRSDFIGRHERLIDGPFPRDVVHHAAIIPRGRPAQRVRAPSDPSSEVRICRPSAGPEAMPRASPGSHRGRCLRSRSENSHPSRVAGGS